MRNALVLCSALSFVALAGCDPETPVEGRDACDYIANACHGTGGGVASACHDVGHDGDLAMCEAMLASCLVACTYDAGTADAGTGTDAGELSDAGLDATTGDAGTEEVVVRFAPRVGSEPFACGTTYALGTPAHDAEPVDFRFYVHDVRLLTADGTEVPLALSDSSYQAMGVALIDFEDGSAACVYGDPETNLELRGTAPVGEYTGVVFRVGVPFELNHVELTTLPSPLNRTSLFWSWNIGHLFLSAMTRAEREGPSMADAGGDDAGTMTVVTEHATHMGSTGCVGNPSEGVPVSSCSRPNRPEIRITGFDPTSETILADFGEIKADDDVTGMSCHSFSPNCAFSFDAMGLNWSTGSVTSSTQTVFRVE